MSTFTEEDLFAGDARFATEFEWFSYYCPHFFSDPRFQVKRFALLRMKDNMETIKDPYDKNQIDATIHLHLANYFCKTHPNALIREWDASYWFCENQATFNCMNNPGWKNAEFVRYVRNWLKGNLAKEALEASAVRAGIVLNIDGLNGQFISWTKATIPGVKSMQDTTLSQIMNSRRDQEEDEKRN